MSCVTETWAPKPLEIGPKGGIAFAAFALLAGGATALGLFAAPRLVSDIVHAAERKAVGETAQRGCPATCPCWNA